MITTLHDPVVTEVDGTLGLTVDITFAPGTLDPASVRFEVRPGDLAVRDPSVVPLVPAAYVLACRASQDLRVTEPLAPALHDGARAVGELLARWYGWRPAELIAPLGPEPTRRLSRRSARRRGGTGVLFTRGVDSWGTVLELLDGPKQDRPTHLITVDNEVHLPRAFRDVHLAETQAVADRLGLPLITVATDIRSALDPHTDWGTDTHGSVFAGIGLLLRPTLGRIVISPTHWTPLLRPWGSHPELEPNWSVPGLEIVHHDGSEPRWRRVERVVAAPLAAETLLVCWQGRGPRNCGRCEKCLRLMTSLELLGMAERCAERFDVPFDPEAISDQLEVSPHPWCETMDHLDHVGLSADPLRQRWEQVRVVGRPALRFETRPIQPRVPLVVDDGDRRITAIDVGAVLAPLGLRVDHEVGGSDLGPAVVASVGPDGQLLVSVRIAGSESPAVPASEVDAAALAPLLDALGMDASTAQPFDPGGRTRR